MFGTLFWGTEHCLLDIDTCLKRSPWPLPAALLPSVNDRSCKSEVVLVGLQSPQLVGMVGLNCLVNKFTYQFNMSYQGSSCRADRIAYPDIIAKHSFGLSVKL